MAVIDFTVPEAGIGLITLNRPERMNAINAEWIGDFHAILDRLHGDASIKVVVLTGAGRGFCGGFDLKASHSYDEVPPDQRVPAGLNMQEWLSSLPERMIRARQPIIAAINGPAAGGGLAIALAADMRVAARNANFAAANSRLGISAGESGMSWLFPRLVGLSRCFELLLTGRMFDAEEADRIGLLTRLVDEGQALEAAMELARGIAQMSGFALRMSKDVIYANLSAPDIRTGSAIENRTQLICGSTGNMQEAAAAFREKRKPQFKV